MRPYRLALDIGTASVGYAIYLLDEKLQPYRLLYGNSRIFSEPTIAKTGELKKAKKRLTKSARKQLSRKEHRYRQLSHLFPLIGLSSDDVSTISRKRESKEETVLALRAKAVGQQISLPELMRVLMHMEKRRGYAGAFRVKTKDKNKGKAEAGVEQTHAALGEGRTIGQYLYTLYQRGESTKNIYALREDYEKEFNQIWDVQSKYHDVLNRCDADKVPIKERFRKAIFKQLPLQGFSDKVGECPLVEGEKRAPKAHPVFQQFRIQETINNLGWGRKEEKLTPGQRQIIEQMLAKKAEVSFESIYKQLRKNGCVPETGVCLNMDTPNRDGIRGNSTLAGFKTLKKLDGVWLALDDETQDAVIRFLADMPTPELPDIPGWRDKTTPDAADFIDKMVDTGKFDRLSKMRNFESGRASYSVKAMQKLLPLLIKNGISTDEAVNEGIKQGWFPSNVFEPLGYLPDFEETGNALVDVPIQQVKKVVEEITECLGNPAQLIVEMGREMGVGAEQKRKRETQQAKNRNANRKLNEELITGGHNPSRENRMRLQLWKEQGGDPNLSDAKIAHCIYSGKPIKISDALDGNATQLDHIRPRKRFFDTRRPQYLILCISKANKAKADQTPWEAFHDSPEVEGIRYDWDGIETRVKQLPRDARFKKKLLLSKVTDAQDEKEFLDRQMHATQWVARSTGQWMKHICPDVSVSKGWLTAQLRYQWGLETVIDEVREGEGLPKCKNKHGEWSKRMDHRHHFIDACVIGLTSRGLFQQAARSFRQQAERLESWSDIKFKVDPPIEDIRRQALDVCKQIIVSHKPDRFLSSKLFDDNPFGLQVENEDDKEKKWLTHRVPLIDLVSKTTREGREALPESNARNNLVNVAGDELRALLLNKLDECLLEDIPFQQGFANLRRYESEKSPPIKMVKIRVTEFDPESHQIVEHEQKQLSGKRYKVLKSAENAYVEIKEKEDSGVDERVVPMFQALEAGKPEKGVRRFYKGDMVTYSKNPGVVYVLKKISREDDRHPIRINIIPHSESRTVGGNRDCAPMRVSDGLIEVTPNTVHYLRHFHTTPAGLKPVIGKLLRE